MRMLEKILNKRWKNKISGDIYEGCVYLGVYDNEDNYEEVSEEDYKKYLENKEKTLDKE